ncbi:MAG: zinc ribbon domain-containing protein [Spirochaetaceae bacterium]|nr:zinc ribbon domain-containing protein [Treponema sp.]MBP3449319.1 zinc ribbon domain-containing protein [Spirochaetaceae bacterium]MBQ3025545.1 zinc ribbon domain-containing protein [Spirochaetaceae bacterium]MBQ7905428.1 zinc ribbon domain-containing protein [Spirochaetaceae bacterium]
MLEVFDRLKTLQDVLAEKYELQAKIEEAPKKLSTQEELLARLKKEYIEKNAIYEEVRKKVARLKTELADVNAAIEKSEKGMDSITTHREYEALDKEINDARELEQTIRNDLKKEEKSLAELNDNLKTEEVLIQRQEEELSDGKKSLQDEIDQYNAKMDDLKKQEEELVPGIDPEIIFKFQRIIRSKHSKGIVAVKGNVCDGCHMILPAQFANDVHVGDKIVFCPYCSRILYYQEVDGADEEYFQMDDTGSLADLGDEFDDEYDEDSEDYDDSDSIKELDY